MTDIVVKNEADSGSGVATVQVKLEWEEEEDQNEAARVTGSNTHYDSSKDSNKCLQCDFEGSQTVLTVHIAQAHSTNEVKMEVEDHPLPERVHRKIFECDVCNMKFSNGANMRRHKMRHTGVKPYECQVCQKKFSRKDHLAEHSTTHTKTLLVCSICNIWFQGKIALRNHFQNEHEGQEDLIKSCLEVENNNPLPDRVHRKMFECDVCNMKFTSGTNMKRHKKKHTGVKPYECRVCLKTFFRKDHLTEHFATHSTTFSYHCPICNKRFQEQIAMRTHFQNEHVRKRDQLKPCQLCSYRGESIKSLRKHFFNRY